MKEVNEQWRDAWGATWDAAWDDAWRDAFWATRDAWPAWPSWRAAAKHRKRLR